MILPRIGISLGDPGGIGPEVSLRALFGAADLPPAQYILFGPAPLLENEAKACGRPPVSALESGRVVGRIRAFFSGIFPRPEGPVRKGVSGAVLRPGFVCLV